MGKRGPVFWLLMVITFIGLAASARILWKRIDYERANRTVQVIVDYPSLMEIAPDAALAARTIERVKNLGVDSFGVYELKSEELFNSNALLIDASVEHRAGGTAPAGGGWEIAVADPAIRQRVSTYLGAYFGPGSCGAAGVICRVPSLGDQWEDLSFGLQLPAYDFKITPRLSNTPFEKKESIALKMSQVDELQDANIVICDGDTALGYPALIEFAAAEIKKRGQLSFGLVEMVIQDGAKSLARKLPGRVVKVHSIPGDEMAVTPLRKAVARYRRAVRERGVRVLYVRFYSDLYGRSAQDELDRNIEYLENIINGVKAEGYTIGIAAPLKPFVVSRLLRALSAAGAVAFAGLLCWIGFGLPGLLSLLASLGTLALLFVLPETAGHYKLLLKLIALGEACFVPPMAVAVMFLRRAGRGPAAPGVVEVTAQWITACALTLAGAAFTAALLSHRDYFLGLELFAGVKLALFMPLVLMFLLYLYNTGETLSGFFDSPLRYAEAAVGVLLMGVVAVYLFRSGNEAAGAVSSSESALRANLEALLLVRPRFKEFLIGHPALLLAGVVPIGKKHYTGLLVLLFGVIGQASLFNTYCHLHSPLDISYLRSLLGIILGLIVGVAVRTGVIIILRAKSFVSTQNG